MSRGERGYTLPWQNEDVLYWLNRLRNCQERYNPIENPVDCTTLERRHTGSKKSVSELRNMGQRCFLFRNPTGKTEEEGPSLSFSIPEKGSGISC
ncbi:VPA1269 family protein [Endozoicomonas sp. OPT23]|uniref:VPA1269 family protein n=1 Tax=Endozoicomonas sp. OPT23 TaxID=2072845 RepID=UPI001891A72B|nr:VPA1269 family protein [Endozoicomonas sp. OPT23]